ncbi:MFS transporter [Actinosynnema pretiosum subsp. pretiosum]|uniref:MFS transporter n=1 Tax=Actinosynnema pretiosum subsp. pretiosum TaxID=103721 RepID=A0AA45L808_9PSEU|nr:putative tetracycline resistance protein [Actinosynnema pretiosum subsp. pretiosum]QUF04763.1 MFS transporter [Actinosynnema pretiosum subsp. pretiosum]
MTDSPDSPRSRLLPLYAAGFVTAFGAHSIAASLGDYTGGAASLLALGLLLAVYDGAEVVLKPVFGALTDRIGPRPVLLGGLLAFAAASAAFVLAGNPALVGLARLGQGAAAAAFSPAASALVARLSPQARHGRVFGGYGAWKGLGYTLGPVLGGVLIHLGGHPLLFGVLAGLALAVGAWALVAVPTVPPLPRTRQTVLDLARRLGSGSFLRPTATLAGATAALAVGVGFLPVAGADLGPLATGAVVSLLAATAALVQPWAGRRRDAGRVGDVAGMAGGLVVAAAGAVAAATLPGAVGLVVAALAIGAGTGLATPIGFAHLAAHTPQERVGQTMGAAEVGRELGDAGGPLLVGAIATVSTLGYGLLGLAAVLVVIALLVARGAATR